MSQTKYDYQGIIEEETVRKGESAHAKLLQRVSYGSSVLECGPAYGFMTRYMTQVLHCQVFVVEIDPDAFAHVMQYAQGGVCADLEEDGWMESLEGRQFDVILYADVLEHLRDPQAVLTKMKRFLSPNGIVLLSVPNVAHGDIIMNQLCDRFTYTPLGLLDNTHIHLFARKNLREMIQNAGYFLAEETCIRRQLFSSEQGAFLPEDPHERAVLEESLLLHPTREIQQFICRLSLQRTVTVSDVDQDDADAVFPLRKARFFFDTGEGYSESRKQEVAAVQRGDRLLYRLNLPEGCISVRYDPVEERKCILGNVFATINEKPVPVVPLNGLALGTDIFFCDEDPQIEIKVGSGDGMVLKLETELVILCSTVRDNACDFVDKAFDAVQKWSFIKSEEVRAGAEAYEKLRGELSRIEGELVKVQYAYQAISTSGYWKVTKPLRMITDCIKSLLRQGKE